jgi:hypothetical protein
MSVRLHIHARHGKGRNLPSAGKGINPRRERGMVDLTQSAATDDDGCRDVAALQTALVALEQAVTLLDPSDELYPLLLRLRIVLLERLGHAPLELLVPA